MLADDCSDHWSAQAWSLEEVLKIVKVYLKYYSLFDNIILDYLFLLVLLRSQPHILLPVLLASCPLPNQQPAENWNKLLLELTSSFRFYFFWTKWFLNELSLQNHKFHNPMENCDLTKEHPGSQWFREDISQGVKN